MNTNKTNKQNLRRSRFPFVKKIERFAAEKWVMPEDGPSHLLDPHASAPPLLKMILPSMILSKNPQQLF
jgi:hypothetical protein